MTDHVGRDRPDATVGPARLADALTQPRTLTAPGQPGSESDEQAGSALRSRVERFGDDVWDMPALPGERAALEALQWHWGEVYAIGVDDGQWWFRRRDGKGGTETASTPDDLRAQIVLDYSLRPVRREPSAATPDRTDPAQETRS